MKIPEHPTLLRRMRDARVKKLAAQCPPLAASLGRQASGGWHVTRNRDYSPPRCWQRRLAG